MSYTTFRLEKNRSVATITLDRPSVKNAFDDILIGELTGADIITDEITAHKSGADFIGRKIGKQCDAIFEIDTISTLPSVAQTAVRAPRRP